jgi:hypothetical protein
VGLQLRDDTAGTLATTKGAVWVPLFNVAVRVTFTLAASAPAAALKVVDVLAAGTMTLAGMVKTELLSESATVTPPAGAG